MKWNHYTCPKCGGITISKEFDEGVTPFMIRCRAKDTIENGNRVQGCNGMAESSFYRGSQKESQRPHIVFYRPSDAIEAIEAINKEPKRFRVAILKHYQKGGSLMREADETDSES